MLRDIDARRAGAPEGAPDAQGESPGAADTAATAPDFLMGGGEMGRLIRSLDWTHSPLGPISSWPQSLKTSVSICLASGFPVLLWWGPELVMLYNDAYRAIIADKHPRAMGQPGRECWPEVWSTIGPPLENVLARGQTSYFEDLMLPLHRRGFAEECYFTFTYSPIRDESGGVRGVFCAVTETTERVYSERQLALLRDLSTATTDARTVRDAITLSMACLARSPVDLPFAALYQREANDDGLVRVGVAGSPPDALPASLPAGAASPWHLSEVAATGITAVSGRGELLVLPVPARGGAPAVLVAGLNPMRALTEGYRSFLALVASQIAASIGNAQAYEEQRRRAESLAEIDRTKTTFFSNVSHELRTPLTLILGPIEALLRGPLAPDDRRQLETAQRNALRLLKLVNTMLDFARIQAARVETVFEPTDLGAYTADLASTFRSAIEAAGLRLVIDCPAQPAPVHVDRGQWEKIVLNLLSNAFKFTLAGEIAVSLAWLGDSVELRVRDTGTGIPAEELPKIFDRFHRVAGARGRTHEGTGIGLALAKELVALHGGTLAVESEAGRGSTFVVRVPVGNDRAQAAARSGEALQGIAPSAAPPSHAKPFLDEARLWLANVAPEQARAPSTSEGAAGQPEAGTVLIADDNPDMRQYLQDILGKLWNVTAVADGIAALAACREQRPDLVLTDVMMPGLDGFDLLARLRAEPATKEIPIIMLSARAGEESRVEGVEAGADDYLIKPFTARELVARVRCHLRLAGMRRAAVQALRNSEERLRTVVENSRDGITLLDLKTSRYLLLSQAQSESLGFSMEEVNAMSPDELVDRFHPDDLEASLAERNRVLSGIDPRGSSFEYRWRTKGGSYRWYSTRHKLVRDQDGQPVALVGVTRDITERKAGDAALLQAKRDLEEADRRKNQFLAVLSHELRNPLAPVKNSLRILDRAAPDSEQAVRAKEVMRRQIDILSHLVDDLLDVTRITSGKIRLQRARVDLRELVRRALEDHQSLFDKSGIELRAEIASEPMYVEGDGNRIAQVLGNLLLNAAKFTPHRGRVTVALARDGEAAELRVRDNGAGIDPALLSRLFQPFMQAEATVARSPGGLGLGLALVKGLVEQHGGQVRAWSEGPGCGAEFSVRLPLDLAERPEPPLHGDLTVRVPRRVLVIEDNADAADTLRDILEYDGHQVAVAYDGAAGLSKAREFRPEVVLCDVGLPDIDGYEVARSFRRDDRLRGTHIVALTGYALPGDLENAAEAGFEHHLAKPVDLEALQDILERLPMR